MIMTGRNQIITNAVNPETRGQRQKPNIGVLLLCSLLLSLLCSTSIYAFGLFGGPPQYVGPIPNVDFKVGRVLARSVVIDPETGEPILVEYNEDGTEASVVNIGSQSINDIAVIAAADYRFEQDRLIQYRAQYADTLADGAVVLSAREFEQEVFKAADNETVIQQPSLPESVNSVLVLPQNRRLSTNGQELILLSFLFDLTQGTFVSPTSVSLVINREGQVVAQSNKAIGFRSGFFGDPNEPQGNRSFIRSRIGKEDTVFGPIPNAKVYVSELAYRGGVGYTDQDGKYSFRFYMPTCPIGGFSFDTDVWADLRYRNFLPTGSPTISYHLKTIGYSYCYADLVPASQAGNVQAILATASVPIHYSNLYADVMFVTGRLAVANLDGSPVPIGTTTRTAFTTPAEKTTQNYYDFNGDGRADKSIQGKIETAIDSEGNAIEDTKIFVVDDNGDYQGIFFDGQQDDADDFPDLVRLIDTALRNEPIGVLESISTEDVRNTDLLFFRESTGQLIMERRGLKEQESKYRPAIVYDQNRQEVAYRVMLRGRSDWNLNIGGGVDRREKYEQWATKNQLTEPFQAKESDHPRPGEYIKIVAINRATGYMGTTRVQLKSAGDTGTTLLDVPAQPIVLRPPNLKIWAERNYDVVQGLTQGETRQYTIGSEGAALTSDTTISIYTEWLDEYGRPLPDELGLDNGEEYGLTGRLAKVVAPNQLKGVSAGSDLAEFPIAPGRHTQVIRVGDNLTTAEHFYIHVIGKPRDQECVSTASCPTFNQTGSEAPYDTRPQLLTPFLVPLADEDRHWQEYNAYRNILRNQEAEGGSEESNPAKPLPAYAWQYRPEYQFSQYSLEVEEINRTTNNTDGSQENINIIDTTTPTIASSDDLISAFYSLIGSDFDRLTPIDGEQELILALGEQEQRVTIGTDQTVTFDETDLASLSSLDPEDFLTLRLYTNNDAANVLWEFAVASGLEGDSNIRVVSADDNQITLTAYFPISIDEGNPRPITVRWHVDGGGSFSEVVTTSSAAFFNTTLITSVEAYTTHHVTARVIASEDERVAVGTEKKFGPFTVAPGVADRITLTASDQNVLNSGVNHTQVIGRVYDQYDNPVAEGTPITWGVGYSGTLQNEASIVNGVGAVTTDYVSGLESLPTEISVFAGTESQTLTLEEKSV